MLTDEQFDGIEKLTEKNKKLSNVRLLMITSKRWLRLYLAQLQYSNLI
jgi:hypothetical protein